MAGENPFFIREVRQMAHRPAAVLVSSLLSSVAMAAALLFWLWLARRGDDPSRYTLTLALMALPHFAACLSGGAFGGDRVFGEEQRRGTLDGIRLLPYRPLTWLALRLWFPLYLLLVAWGVGLPFYMLAVSAGLAPLSLVSWVALIPLGTGLLALPLLLLLPPDYRERLRRMRTTPGPGASRADPDMAIRFFLVYTPMLTFQFVVASGAIRRIEVPRPWYGTSAPGWLVPAVVAALLLAACLVTAHASASADERTERRAFRVRAGALVAIYYLLAGMVTGGHWATLSVGWRAAVLAAVPLGLLFLVRGMGRRQEDHHSGPEVRWAAGRWDNPLWLRDLRVFTRFASARSTLLKETAVLAAVVLVIAYASYSSGRTSVQFLDVVTYLGGVFGPTILTLDASMRAWNAWTRDRLGRTLPLLFLTPLPSGEILLGRLYAAAAYSVSVHFPLVVASLLGLFWWAARGFWYVPPVAVALSPMALLFAVALGSAVRPQNVPPWKWPREDWLEAGLGLLQLGVLYLSLAAILGGGRPPAGVVMLAPPALFLANLAIVWVCFRLRIRVLNALRRGEIELVER